MPACGRPAARAGTCSRVCRSRSRFISRLTPPVSAPGSYTGGSVVDEIERIRDEYQERARTVPADFYAWHRGEIQYGQAGAARACARLLRESGAFPIAQASIAD